MIRAASAVFAWLCVAAPLSHAVMTDGTFAINREVVAAGGSTMSSGVFSSTGTVGQGAIGDAADAAFALSAGFWPDVAVIITFAFAPQSNAPLATAITSNTITIAGLSGASPISIAGGSYSVNGGAYTTAPGTVNNTDTVTVRLTSSATYATTMLATVTIAGVSASFNVTTSAALLTISGPNTGGSGTITALAAPGAGQPSSCGFASASQFIALVGAPRSPPAGTAPLGVAFPYGLFDFSLVGCAPGGSVTLTITYPQAVPPGAQYWKYGPTSANPSPHWYVIPASFSGSTASFTIVDGGLGDDDLTANGTLVDQGGPGVPALGGVAAVPALSEWGLLLLTALMGLLGFLAVRRRALLDRPS